MHSDVLLEWEWQWGSRGSCVSWQRRWSQGESTGVLDLGCGLDGLENQILSSLPTLLGLMSLVRTGCPWMDTQSRNAS